MNKILTTIILLLSVLPSVGNAQIFGPSNYEDCIIEGMQGVASDVAAVAVRSACREKFPNKPIKNQPDWEGTCLFLLGESSEFIKQISPTERALVSEDELDVTYRRRDGFTHAQFQVLIDALRKADKEKDVGSATSAANAIRSISKHIFYPKLLPLSFIQTLDIPYCAQN